MQTRKSLAGYWIYKDILYIINNDRTDFRYKDYVANRPNVSYSGYGFDSLRTLTSKNSGRYFLIKKALRNGQQISCFLER